MKQTIRPSWPLARVLRATLAVLATAGLLYGAWFGFWRYHLKRLTAVREGVLYRVAQPTEFGFDYLAKHRGVKTVLSLQLYDPHLDRGLYDPGEPDGASETAYVTSLGIRHVQWAMGTEVSWPWMTPWQYEEFFKLFDNPANSPVAVHCAGGRHRTGTISALFRLEYDRWPIERTLAEMYSFKFGGHSPLQELNLRAYYPRPRPDEKAWAALDQEFSDDGDKGWDSFVTQLAMRRPVDGHLPPIESRLQQYMVDDRPFALPLAQRLIEKPDDPLVPVAVKSATSVIDRTDASYDEWFAAAALIADFGTPAQQNRLIEKLRSEMRAAPVSQCYSALVAGVENRYTENRLPYWKAILEDNRPYIEPALADMQYGDLAVVKMTATLDTAFLVGSTTRANWDLARDSARQWFEKHPEAARFRQLVPPKGNNPVMAKEGRAEEDLSRLKDEAGE